MTSVVVVRATNDDGQGSAHSHAGRGNAIEAQVSVLVNAALNDPQMNLSLINTSEVQIRIHEVLVVMRQPVT